MAATWKKVVVSGSAAQLQSLQVDANVSVTGSLLVSTNQIITSAQSTTQLTGSFTGSFTGDGAGLTNIPASGITGLQLNQIASGSATASIAPDLGFRVNTDTQITGSLSVSSSASTLKIEGNGFSQTYFSTNGALVLNPGSGGVGMAGVNQTFTLGGDINSGGNIIATGANSKLTGSFSGSFKGILDGTASQATSASYALTASSAIYSLSASFATTASFVTTAQTASFVVSASFATSASYALTASSAVYSLSASFATSASRSERAGIADTTNASLTQGTGITAFTFDGSTAQTVTLKNASSLTNNVVSKWDSGNGQFVNSNITDNGSAVSVGSGIPVTVNSNLTVTGDLTVAGTASFNNTQNLLIADRFAVFASGSTSLTDGGIIIASSTGGGGISGSAFFVESATAGTYGRFAVAYNVHASASAVVADEYMNSSKLVAGAPSDATPPTWGGSTNGVGNMWVNTITSDIYIWA
jgi:hypothetical protein